MIVLGIMVGVAALTFPRLTRPLAETEAHQAANRLREAITDCRQAAALRGEPLFLRLVAGETRVAWGDWSVLLADESAGGTDAGGAPASSVQQPAGFAEATSAGESPTTTQQPARQAASGRTSPLQRSLVLPHEVVVEAVRWGRASSSASGIAGGEDETAGGAEPAATDAASPSPPPPTRAAAGPAGAEAPPASGQWYLPFLPSGRTRNCQIILRDTLVGTRLMLELDAVTGMTRLERLTSATPRETAAGGATSSAFQ